MLSITFLDFYEYLQKDNKDWLMGDKNRSNKDFFVCNSILSGVFAKSVNIIHADIF